MPEGRAALAAADVVFHLAGVNRPRDPADFAHANQAYAGWVAEAIEAGGRRPLMVCSSSARAVEDNDYARSKRGCETALLRLADHRGAVAAIYRLPNVFGKWARPDYNSAVATFCHNLARGLPIHIDDASAPLALLYVDDLIDQWLGLIESPPRDSGFIEAEGVHHTTVGEVAAMLAAFAEGRTAGQVGDVGSGLERALYATFVSALPKEAFSYPLAPRTDARGSFVEVLRSPGGGQVSFFTAHPGVTRGGHYHHSKVEKFVVVQGEALFRFRHILTGDRCEVRASAERPVVVETIPGWAHDVTNVGAGALVSLLWANEVFDHERPDTVAMPV
jgi:UDP-2-acetamido-2,6-beta-L-arabino-hexul-4-ose reductase